MAGGYLGKISAVISANTGDYVRKLGESAKETTNFARTVERTLSRASSEAARSLQSIYTPLQQFERALRAAASERLSFKGFDGAIRTVEELKKRLAGIKASDVDIVVKASGQKTLTDLRNVINDISTKDIDLFRNVGGLAGLQKARAEIEALSQRTDIVVKPKVSLAELDRLIAKFSQIDDTQINAVIKVFGDRELDAALTKARRLQELGARVGTPLAGAAQQFDRLAGSVQAAFVPALNRAQQAVEAMKARIESGADVGVREFRRLEQQVTRTSQAISRLSEADAVVSRLGRGTDLRSVAPRQSEAFARAASQQSAANELPATVAAGFGLNRQQATVTSRAAALSTSLAQRERAVLGRQDTTQIDAAIQRQTQALEAALDVQQRLTVAARQYAEARNRADTGTFQPLGDLQKAAADLARVQQQLRDVRAAAQFGTTVSDAFETAQIDSYRAKLKLLQDILIANGVSSGDAAEEVNNLADALRRVASTRGGFLDPRAQEGLRMQEDAAVNAVAAAAPAAGGVAGVTRRLERAGDVGRAGFDKFSLAAQQAGFAVDDFLSSTGGLDQKLRAVSNNITQLAFILGGTNGLFIGLGAVIGGQVVSALAKFANGGANAELQANALNESLARQKSLVQDLAQAFESLGAAIASRGFSQPTQRAREFERELTSIEKKQREIREERFARLDPAVQRERADRAELENRLRAATSVPQRIALQREIEASRQRERAAVEAAANRPAASGADVRAAIGQIGPQEFFGRPFEELRQRRARLNADLANAGNDPIALQRIVRERIAERQRVASTPIGPLTGNAEEILRARADIARLTSVLDSLESAASKAADALAVDFLRSASAAANELETAQSRASQAIESAVPSAAGLQATLDTFAKQIADAERIIRESIENESLTAEDRKAIVEKAEKEIADARIKREEATAKAAQLAFQRIVDPRSLLENVIGRSQQSLQDSGFVESRIARDLRVLEAQRQDLAARLNERPDDALTRGVVQSGLEAINQQAAALEAATLALRAFGEALKDISQSAAQDVGSLQQRAEQARRNDIRLGTPETSQRRSEAEADLRAGREAQRQVENSVQNARERAEQQIVANGTRLGERLRQIDEQLAVPANQVSTTGVQGGTLAEREALRQERASLQAQANAAVENDRNVRTARRQQDSLTRRAEDAAAADRGREAGRSPLQKAQEDIRSNVNDLRAAAATFKNVADIREFLRQGAENLAQQVAPAIMGFRDERMNAMLQGPSRAALNVADVQTVQGQAELNRLLRGDDPNRNVNLEELRNQSQLLQGIIDAIKSDTGVVVDIRG